MHIHMHLHIHMHIHVYTFTYTHAYMHIPTPRVGGGAVLPYLGMVWRLRGDDPRLGPYFIPQHNPINPLFLQEKSVCLYHISFQRY